MYLKQKGLKISGSKAELIDRILTHARGNLGARMLSKMRNLPVHAKTTQAQSPVGGRGGGGLGLILSLCEGG